MAFLMRYHNMMLADAHKLVKTQRPKVGLTLVISSTHFPVSYRFSYCRSYRPYRSLTATLPQVRPNDGFWRQLIEYERSLFNCSTVRFIRTRAGVIPSVYLNGDEVTAVPSIAPSMNGSPRVSRAVT